MDKNLLELASEAVFCSEPAEIRYAESMTSRNKLVLAGIGLFSSIFSLMWWYAPEQFRGGLSRGLGLIFPVSTMTAGYIGLSSKEDANAETFEAAYKMKCNYCMDDERCEALYGKGWECVDGECMEVSDDGEEDDN